MKNPKPETRMAKDIRNPQCRSQAATTCLFGVRSFGILSDFGLRISGFKS